MKYLFLFLISLNCFAADNYIAKSDLGKDSGYNIYLNKEKCERVEKNVCFQVPAGLDTSVSESYIDVDSKEKIRINSAAKAIKDAEKSAASSARQTLIDKLKAGQATSAEIQLILSKILESKL